MAHAQSLDLLILKSLDGPDLVYNLETHLQNYSMVHGESKTKERVLAR